MKIINTKLHGILDYTIAFILILPWIVDYYPASEDTWALALIGGIILVYSLMTDYEFGIMKFIPVKLHFLFDGILSLILISSPHIFHLDHYTHWPVIIGVLGLLIVLSTSSEAYRITRRDLDITKP